MNKIFKVIWNEARNAYVVVSEIAKNHGSKSCSTKKLLAMLIATGVMTCAGMAPAMAQPVAVKTNDFQYVALKAAAFAEGEPTRWNRDSWNKDFTSLEDAKTEWNAQRKDGQKPLGDYTYKYDAKNGYWVRDGYVLTVDQKGGKYTPLSANQIRADVAYKDGVAEGILQSVTSTVAHNGVVTHSGDSLQKVTAGSYAGVSNSGGTEVAGSWNYIINDSSWENSGAEYQNGYVDLKCEKGEKMPKGFKTTDSGLNWDEVKQTYTYQGKAVDYRNMYVIDGKLGVFTNADGSDVYTGTVYGKNNEILMTVKDNGKFYSYWAASVTAPSATMETYPVSKYNSDLAVIDQNIKDLNKDIIKEVTLTKDTNSAIIGLVRNGGNAVDGAITVTSGGGTDGKDTFVTISNGKTEQTFATGSKVEAIGSKDATTGIKINGKDYTIKSGSKVSVTQNADEKTTTITVDGQATTITDTDTTYTEGDGIEISDANAISVSKNLTGMQSINGAGGTINSAITVNKTTFNKDGRIQNVANGTETKDAVNFGQLQETNNKVENLKVEAGKHTTLSDGKNTTVTSTNKDGQIDYQVNVAGDLTDITSVANGDSKINLNKDSISISNGNKYFAITNSGIGMSYIGADNSAKSIMLGENGTTISGGLNVAGSKITGVAAGVEKTDAVNVGQLNAAVQAGNTDTHIKAGEYGVGEGNKVNMQLVDKNGKDAGTVTITDVAKASDVGNVTNINNDLKNPNGTTTVVDAVNNLNQKLDKKVGDLNYVEGGAETKGNYVTNGESTTVSIGKLDQALKDVATTAAKHTTVSGSSNIVVEPPTTNTDGGKNYNVKLADEITVNSVTANTFTAGQTVVMNKDGLMVGNKVSVSATAVTAGKTSISDEGVKVDGKTYISADGLNANDKKVTNVADGKVEKDSKDAINGGQLHQAKADINNRIDGVENQVISNSNRINQLGNRVNKVGAGAAALAALHPMDFDPDDKLTFSAGYGNYAGENAAAIGAYYRPDEKVMFSVGGTVGNGENMVNAGVSFALDRTNHVSNSRTALAREVIDLRGQLAVMGAKMAKMEKALGMLDETKTKLFPDIPANHWAYEYIAKLAGNGYIEGYPDGNFGGDRLMTRYEFAAMLYRAIENGAALEEKIIEEFEPELGRIRVDRISGEDGDRDKIERVRVNDTKGERDHYGNKLAK